MVEDEIHVDLETGTFIDASSNDEPDILDLDGKIVAPGYLELQSNVSDQAKGLVSKEEFQ